jgi:hypothetical protein
MTREEYKLNGWDLFSFSSNDLGRRRREEFVALYRNLGREVETFEESLFSAPYSFLIFMVAIKRRAGTIAPEMKKRREAKKVQTVRDFIRQEEL